ncbi:MAG TPA: zinc ribbon domain-containing protein [Candidatus Nitrosotenuis sp.]|nr:zinc ribbon domain-containing protein [Candidatus Nitrosotenuis sp.]
MPTSAQAEAPGLHRFPCPNCGATLVFAAGVDRLKCEYCGGTQEVPAQAPGRPGAGAGPVEHSLHELLSGSASKGWGAATRTFQCGQCGASTTLPQGQTSGKCAFCGSNVVAERAPNPDLITPESLIPFKIPKEEAVKRFRQWLSGLWFRPNNLKHMAQVADIQGVYTPFWTFDARASTRWSAESGYHYYETEEYTDTDGTRRTRQVQKTRWEPSSGFHQAAYDDILICASRGLSEGLVRQLEPYDTRGGLVAYQPAYLAGWQAEEYALGPREAWQKGQEEFERLEYQACSAQVPGDTHRNLNISMRLEGVTWKHCLLPLWIAAYRYQGKPYRFMVNGQTGKVSGEAPLSWWKVLGCALLLAALLLLLVALGGGLALLTGGGTSLVPGEPGWLGRVWAWPFG